MNADNEMKELALRLRDEGMEVWVNHRYDTWLYVNVNDRLLYVETGAVSGFYVDMPYVPSREYGSSCRVDEFSNMFEINREVMNDCVLTGEALAFAYGVECYTSFDDALAAQWDYECCYKL